MTNEKLISAIILAGGRSSRFGEPKAWAEWGGKPLIQHVADRLKADACEVIAVFRELPEELLPASIDTIAYDVPSSAEGPLRGMVAGLNAMKSEWAFVVGCDTPLIEPGLMMRLFEQRRENDQVILPVHDMHLQSLVALYHRSSLETMEDALKHGIASPKKAMEELNVHIVSEDKWVEADPHGFSFMNINDQESLHRLNAVMNEGSH